MRHLLLSCGNVARLDDVDFDRVIALGLMFNSLAGTNTLYARAQIGAAGSRTETSLHRFVMGEEGGPRVDHVDGDGLNNQRNNLRFCSVAQNAMNQRHSKRMKLGKFKGVAEYGRYWTGRIRIDGKNITLGYYPTPRDAALAYDRAAETHFGEFAALNFPGETTMPSRLPCPAAVRQAQGKYRGVTLRGIAGVTEKPWQVYVSETIEGRRKGVYVGSFSDPVAAARAYDVAALERQGEKAVLNFPEAKGSAA